MLKSCDVFPRTLHACDFFSYFSKNARDNKYGGSGNTDHRSIKKSKIEKYVMSSIIVLLHIIVVLFCMFIEILVYLNRWFFMTNKVKYL